MIPVPLFPKREDISLIEFGAGNVCGVLRAAREDDFVVVNENVILLQHICGFVKVVPSLLHEERCHCKHCIIVRSDLYIPLQGKQPQLETWRKWRGWEKACRTQKETQK